MQIRPVMPSFKGYIELNATRINSHPSGYTTFNTNSIIVTSPPIAKATTDLHIFLMAVKDT